MQLPNMPVSAAKDDILSSLKTKQVLVLSAPTGGGKSSLTPIILNKAGYPPQQGMIIVTQTRRVAATALCGYVSQLYGTPIGQKVGHRVRFNHALSEDTQILFETEGETLIGLGTKPHFDGCSVLMIDEAHEMTANTELLLGFAKLALEQRPEFRVIVSSATMDSGKIAAFFDGKAATVSCSGRLFEVKQHFEDSNPLFGYSPNIADYVAQKAADLIESGKQGDILVFLPGFSDLRRAQEYFERTNLPAETLLAHGNVIWSSKSSIASLRRTANNESSSPPT